MRLIGRDASAVAAALSIPDCRVCLSAMTGTLPSGCCRGDGIDSLEDAAARAAFFSAETSRGRSGAAGACSPDGMRDAVECVRLSWSA